MRRGGRCTTCVMNLASAARVPGPATMARAPQYDMSCQKLARAALIRFITQVVRRPPLRTGGVLLWRGLAGR